MTPAPVLGALLLLQRAVGDPPTLPFSFPTDPLSPRAVAVGNAGAALASDGEASLNPAGIGGTTGVSAYRYEGFFDYQGVSASASVTVFNRFTFGLTGRRFSFEDVVVDIPDATGLDVSEEAFALVGAFRVGFVWFGGSVSQQVVNTFGSLNEATSLSLGAIVHPWSGGAFGLAARNLGEPVRSEFGREYPLDTRVRAGAAQQFAVVGREVSVAADVELRTKQSAGPGFSLGIEVPVVPAFRLRGGIESPPGLDTGAEPSGGTSRTRWSFGIGLKVGPLDLGVAARFGTFEGEHELFIGIDAFR